MLKLDFNRMVVGFASHLDALGAQPCIHWDGLHLIIPIRDGRLKHRSMLALRPHFQDLVLMFLGRSADLGEMNAGRQAVSLTCRDLRCAAPDHLTIESRRNFLKRNKCRGPPCNGHDGAQCLAVAERLPPVLPQARVVVVQGPVTTARKVAIIKREAKNVMTGVRGMQGKVIEMITAPEGNENAAVEVMQENN